MYFNQFHLTMLNNAKHELLIILILTI